jgi:hypothetical protein
MTFGGTGRPLHASDGNDLPTSTLLSNSASTLVARSLQLNNVALLTPSADSTTQPSWSSDQPLSSNRPNRPFIDDEPELDDYQLDKVIARALEGDTGRPYTQMNDALINDRKRWLSGQGVLGFRSAPSAEFAEVRLTPHLASSIPSSDSAAVNIKNWKEAPKLPQPGFQ